MEKYYDQELPGNTKNEKEKKDGKYLTFFLGKEEYGLPILAVQEIIALIPITPVPRTPEFLKGLTNLRGKIIPVMDLRLKFGMKENNPTEETCIIVVRTSIQLVGLVVDKVSEVKKISEQSVDDPPELGYNSAADYLLAIAKTNDSVILIINIEKVVSNDEMSTISLEGIDDSSIKADEN